MLTPEKAAQIVERQENAKPVFSSHGPRKGLHVKYSYRYEITGSHVRHIAIARRQTDNGVTFYINAKATSGKIFSASEFPFVSVLQFYPYGFAVVSGEKGLSSSAGTLASLLPLNNDVYRLSASNESDFTQLVSWYVAK
jgi:hypothetical protein